MIQYSIYHELSLKSFEVRVDGFRETSETIASECDVTFELYRMYIMYTKLLFIGYYLKLVLYAGNFYHKN